MNGSRRGGLKIDDIHTEERSPSGVSIHDVYVDLTEGRGRGLFIAKAGKAGETVLTERPLVGMQSLDNAQDVTVCRNCLGFAGDVISQLEILSGVPRQLCLERFDERHKGDNAASKSSHGALSGLYRCLQGCGEVYCSAECRVEHFERGHRLLCVGPVSEEEAPTHPLFAFRVHATQTNEIFLLAGEVMAQIASAFVIAASTGADPRPATVSESERAGVTAQAPFADFVQEPWWDVAVAREKTDNALQQLQNGAAAENNFHNQAAALSSVLRSLCEESASLLRDALSPLPPELEEVVTTERMGRLIGMFEQNNVGIRVSSPLPSMLRDLLEGDHVTGSNIVEEAASLVIMLDAGSDTDSSGCDDQVEDETWTSDDSHDRNPGCCEVKSGDRADSPACSRGDSFTAAGTREEGSSRRVHDPVEILKEAATDYGDQVFTPLDGTALYSLVCCMNHSCRPNCLVIYPQRRSSTGVKRADPLVAHVVLLEDVRAGEELTQSYINKEMSLQQRRNALEDYGFLCRCPRCMEETGISQGSVL